MRLYSAMAANEFFRNALRLPSAPTNRTQAYPKYRMKSAGQDYPATYKHILHGQN